MQTSEPIRNQRSPMQYRRFGRTGQQLSVITLGGMRYKDGWSSPRDQVPADMLAQCRDMVQLSLDAGINHIETAHGYGRSEYCYGKVLNEELRVPRSSYHLMTKGAPSTGAEMRRLVEAQLKGLQTDRIDLYGYHGINNREILDTAVAKGGPVEELLKLRDEGVIGAVGFSTHGPLEVIVDALATGLFSFMNVHYYYFFQRNAAAVAYAHAKDIGVFIISPNDKGGQLFNAPKQLRDLTAPLTPIQFNARWCLKTPQVQTLSFGMTEPSHVTEMRGVFPVSVPLSPPDRTIEQALEACVDPQSAWEGFEMLGDPSRINIPEVLRFRRLWRCFGMRDFCSYRYNMLEEKGHWFPGVYATDEAIAQVDATKAPPGIDVRAMLAEMHREFYKSKAR
ncbi:MAG: aldo/keto reductase [Planctomycetes bacterium]|nr:aldo/keto reductase [Planctomycetota bacterium]